MEKLLYYLWQGILLIVAVYFLAVFGKMVHDFFMGSHSILSWLGNLAFGAVFLGSGCLLGYIFYKMIDMFK